MSHTSVKISQAVTDKEVLFPEWIQSSVGRLYAIAAMKFSSLREISSKQCLAKNQAVATNYNSKKFSGKIIDSQ